MDEAGIRKLRQKYETASRDILDILKDNDDYSAIGQLAKEMGS